MCTSEQVSDKVLYPTFARTNPADKNLGPSVLAVLKQFDWDVVGIISETMYKGTGMEWERRAKGLEAYLKSNGITVAAHEKIVFNLVYFVDIHGPRLKSILKSMMSKTRSKGTYVMLCYAMLCYVMLCCVVLCYVVLHFIAFYCIVLYCIVLYCIVLFYFIL